MSVRVGIIGNARNMSPPADARLFAAMVEKALWIMREKLQLDMEDVVLVSGGAAWGDHVAVALYLDGAAGGLELHLPCPWSLSTVRFADAGADDWRSNPGRLANRLHRSFGSAASRDSLGEIETARRRGCVVFGEASTGFHARNTAIATSVDYLIAFTRDKSEPVGGGTADTWKKFKNKGDSHKCVHVDTTTLFPPSASTSSSNPLAAGAADVMPTKKRKRKEEPASRMFQKFQELV